MDGLHLDTLEKLLDRERFELVVVAMADSDLAKEEHARGVARRALEDALKPDQLELYMTYADAASDAAAAHEAAAIRVALTHGVAVGAALASHPEEDAGALARVGVDVAEALLASSLPLDTAQDVAGSVLDTLGRLRRVRLSAGKPAPGRGLGEE